MRLPWVCSTIHSTHSKEKAIGEEGYTPDNYARQVEFSEAYRLNAERLEQQAHRQHHIKAKPLSTTRRILLALLAIILVAVAVIATTTLCLSIVPA